MNMGQKQVLQCKTGLLISTGNMLTSLQISFVLLSPALWDNRTRLCLSCGED